MNHIDHVALVVESIESAVVRLGLALDESAIEEFPSEGTRELYVGAADQSGRLLLMQPIADGPYMRALIKRGEGLHHVAFRVENLADWTAAMTDSGWQIHAASPGLAKPGQTIWLYQLGVNCLFEIDQGVRRYPGGPFISGVEVPVAELGDLLLGLDVDGLAGVVAGAATLAVGGRVLNLSTL